MSEEFFDFYLSGRPRLFGSTCNYRESIYAVFGVPFDSTSSFLPGSRFAPLFIRLYSQDTQPTIGRTPLNPILSRVSDLGDLNFTNNVREMLKRTWRIAKKIISDGKIPIIIGGEHTLTLASALASASENSPIIVFDAHLDLLDEYMDTRTNHATWLRRLTEKRVLNVIVVGVRDFGEEELSYAEENSVKIILSESIHSSLSDVIEELRKVSHSEKPPYISVDIDVLDPAYAPGVGNPVSGGLTPIQLDSLLRAVSDKGFIGFDIVEVNPLIDKGLSAIQAVRAIAQVLSTPSVSLLE